MEDERDERHDLYEKFKREIINSGEVDYFDEDVLVEIFDYAGDIGDDFMRLEVLLCGARLYPDSEALRVRRGYYYYTLGYEDGAGAMVASSNSNQLLSKILKVRVENPAGDNAAAALSQILDELTDIDDEGAIQLVDLASSLDCYMWLKNNYDKILSLCSYKPTFIYETAIVAELNYDYDYAALKLEELTMLEPFNETYWKMLAQIKVYCDDDDAALNALEYALAINKDSVSALILKAQLIYQQGESSKKEALAILNKVGELDAHNVVACKLRALILLNQQEYNEAWNLLVALFEEQPEDREILDYLLMINKGEYSTLITRYFSQRQYSEDDIIKWSDGHANGGRLHQAIAILEGYLKYGLSCFGLTALCRYYYILGEYTKVLRYIEDRNQSQFENIDELVFITELNLLEILSLLRLNNCDEALKLSEELERQLQSQMFPSKALTIFENKFILNNLLELQRRAKYEFLDMVDPYQVFAISQNL